MISILVSHINETGNSPTQNTLNLSRFNPQLLANAFHFVDIPN
jgi:hypothetical protein